MNFRKSSKWGGGHFRSRKLYCKLRLYLIVKWYQNAQTSMCPQKICNMIFKVSLELFRKFIRFWSLRLPLPGLGPSSLSLQELNFPATWHLYLAPSTWCLTLGTWHFPMKSCCQLRGMSLSSAPLVTISLKESVFFWTQLNCNQSMHCNQKELFQIWFDLQPAPS